jgi:hypothetical protein
LCLILLCDDLTVEMMMMRVLFCKILYPFIDRNKRFFFHHHHFSTHKSMCVVFTIDDCAKSMNTHTHTPSQIQSSIIVQFIFLSANICVMTNVWVWHHLICFSCKNTDIISHHHWSIKRGQCDHHQRTLATWQCHQLWK